MLNTFRKILAISAFAVTASTVAAQGTSYDLGRYGIAPAGYSGIASLGNGRYAVVSDMDTIANFHTWSITFVDNKPTIKDETPENAFVASKHSLALRDLEGVCFDSDDNTVWISSEASQRVVELSLKGVPTGRELPIPEAYGLKHITSNRGFEVLTYDKTRHTIWVGTENSLKSDPELQVHILGFDVTDLTKEPKVVDYTIDSPKATTPGRNHVHGLSAAVAMDDGRLLFVEREAYIAQNYVGSKCWCKLYCMSPDTAGKHLVTQWQTSFGIFDISFANYEGICMGENLSDGTPTALLVSDSQGGYGISHWHLRDYLYQLPIVVN